MNKGKKLYRNKDLLLLSSVTLISVMGVTSIAPALPMISRALAVPEGSMALMISVFTLPGIILAPFLGIAADRRGRKAILVPSLLLYATAGTACAFTENFPLLLALRFAQGAGTAALGAVNLAIIGDLFQGRDRATALGYNSTVIGIGTMAYPALGGALAKIGWQWPFVLSALAFPVALLIMKRLDIPGPAAGQSMGDYFSGAVSHFRGPRIIAALGATCATFILLYGVVISYLPFYLSRRFGADSLVIGTILASASVATTVGSFNLGRISGRLSRKTMITAAFVIYAVALVIFPICTSLWATLLPMMMYGFANGINVPSIQSVIADHVPSEYRGAFMALNATVLRAGQTVGPAFAGLAFAAGGTDGVILGGAGFSLAVAATVALAVRGPMENPNVNSGDRPR